MLLSGCYLNPSTDRELTAFLFAALLFKIYLDLTSSHSYQCLNLLLHGAPDVLSYFSLPSYILAREDLWSSPL